MIARGSLSGCALALAMAASASASGGAAPAGCNRGWPVIAHQAGGVVVHLPSSDATPVACGVQTGYASSESTIAVASDRSLIYSPAETENSMARSTDAAASWNLTYPAVEQPTSFWNTVDPDLAADRRTGWVFWARNTGPVRNEGSLPHVNPFPQGAGFYLAAAQGFQVYASSDDGRSWSTADYSTAPTGDWQKLAVGPPPKTSGLSQPSGYPDVVYLCANSPFEVSGPGRLCYKSLDGGATFTIAGYVTPSASAPPDVCPALNYSSPVVDSRGALYQPVSCENADYIAVSHDEGSTYSWLRVPVATPGTFATPNLQLAADDADTLYAIWPANDLIYLAISRDHGRDWGPPLMVAAPGTSNVQHPAIVAGAAGNVAFTYYASTEPNAQKLTAYITQTKDGLDAHPLFYSAPINDPRHPIFHDYGLSYTPRTDFIGGAYDQAGTIFWAGVVKQLGPPDQNQNIPTVGYVGTLKFSTATRTNVP